MLPWYAYIFITLAAICQIVLVIMIVLKIVLYSTVTKQMFLGDNKDLPHPAQVSLKFLQYNVFWRPVLIHMGRKEYVYRRAEYLLSRIVDYDIVCFEESFSFSTGIGIWFIKIARELGFKYALTLSPPPVLSHQVLDGGLMILSKYPILETDEVRYESYTGVDGFAAKGALYAKIAIDNTNHLHLFSTHLQASYTYNYSENANDIVTRRRQIAQFYELINKHVDGEYPALLLGDFNIDSKGPEYEAILPMLKNVTGYEMKDYLYESFGEHPITYGDCTGGYVHETVLTEKTGFCSELSIDYVFGFEPINGSKLVMTAHSKVVENFVASEPYIQLSDHYSIGTDIIFSPR